MQENVLLPTPLGQDLLKRIVASNYSRMAAQEIVVCPGLIQKCNSFIGIVKGEKLEKTALMPEV